jgi:hypothetical protein
MRPRPRAVALAVSLAVAASGAGGGLATSQASAAKDDQDVTLEEGAKHPDASGGVSATRAPAEAPVPGPPLTATG